MIYLKNKKAIIVFCFSFFFLLLSCIEPYNINSTENFKELLVVEGRVTNRLGYQKLSLTTTYPLEGIKVPPSVKNANVVVYEDSNLMYEYEEESPGKYKSKVEFKAQENKTYQLKITLQSGKEYVSDILKLPEGPNQDFNITIKKTENSAGNQGVLFEYEKNTNNTIDIPTFYRFNLNATYEIAAPFWTAFKFKLFPDTKTIDVVPRGNKKGSICYIEENNSKSFLFNSRNFSGNLLGPFEVVFLDKEDKKIGRRYSVELEQYVLSKEAFSFYRKLKEFSESESVFSENQPGNIVGNVRSSENPNDVALGFFEVSKVISKRVFFSYKEFFTLNGAPPYVEACFTSAPHLEASHNPIGLSLYEMIEKGMVEFWGDTGVPPIPNRPYKVASKICADCTLVPGSKEKPDYWID